MIAPLKISNGYLTMTYGHGDEIQGRCKNPTTTIQFVCDDVVPEGVGVSQCLNDIPVDVPDEELSLRRISSPRTKLLAARCECLHLIKINCLAL
jgi:hypothetical protein